MSKVEGVSLSVSTTSLSVLNGDTQHSAATFHPLESPHGEPVVNRDLWQILISKVKKLAEKGLDVQFWHISEELNITADTAAKKAAEELSSPEKWEDTIGTVCAV